MLFSETGITSSSAQQRQSANLALASAMAEAPHELFPHVEQALRHIIDQAAHASLTHNDVKIFFTPEGEPLVCGRAVLLIPWQCL